MRARLAHEGQPGTRLHVCSLAAGYLGRKRNHAERRHGIRSFADSGKPAVFPGKSWTLDAAGEPRFVGNHPELAAYSFLTAFTIP